MWLSGLKRDLGSILATIYAFTALCLWASQLTSLILCFFFCKAGLVVSALPGHGDKQARVLFVSPSARYLVGA